MRSPAAGIDSGRRVLSPRVCSDEPEQNLGGNRTRAGQPVPPLPWWEGGNGPTAVERFYAGGEKNCLLGAMVLSGGLELFEQELGGAVRGDAPAASRALALLGAGPLRADGQRVDSEVGFDAGQQLAEPLLANRVFHSPDSLVRVIQRQAHALKSPASAVQFRPSPPLFLSRYRHLRRKNTRQRLHGSPLEPADCPRSARKTPTERGCRARCPAPAPIRE